LSFWQRVKRSKAQEVGKGIAGKGNGTDRGRRKSRKKIGKIGDGKEMRELGRKVYIDDIVLYKAI
jgi:hypothetical protein